MSRPRDTHATILPFAAGVRRLAASLAAGAVAFSAVAAAAAPAKPVCYSRAEHAAEQTIRMHTELMVIGLTCQAIMPADAPFGKYQDFTIKNRTFISASEKVMIEHFKKTAGAGATRKFDTYRTELANEIARRAGVIGTGLYCAEFVQRAKNALALTGDDLKTLTTNERDGGLMLLASRPLCDVKVASLPDEPVIASAPASRDKKPAANKPKPPATTAKAPAKPPAKAPTKAADAKAAAPITTAQKP